MSAPTDGPRARLAALLERHGLSTEHPPAALAEAEAWAAAPGIDDPTLVDLGHLPFVTVDELSSRDLDQALCIQDDGDGGHLVWYALADAAHFVRPGTALWDAALARGSSYYLPGLVAPMLPRVLSEDVCSLNPQVDRRALVFRMAVDSDGRCTDTQMLRARIHSRAKLTYDGVQRWLDGAPDLRDPGQDHPVVVDDEVQASLRRLPVVGKRRMALADERNVVRFRREEVVVRLRGDGPDLRFVAWGDMRNDVERYNEQISLLCNSEGARFLRGPAPEGLVQPIYRVHSPPKAQRLATFEASVVAIVAAHGLDPARWLWDGARDSLGDYLDGLPSSGAQGRIARAIHRQAMVSCGRATFTDQPGIHHGVGADVYARFSAPMREVVGVFLHEEAVEKLAGVAMPVPAGVADDEALRLAVIAAANQCHQVQKALDRGANRMVLDQLFTDDLAQSPPPGRAGTLMGATTRKLHVQLAQPPVDVKVYLHHLEAQDGERLRVSSDGARVVESRGGALRMAVGDAVEIRVLGRDADADRWALDCRKA